MEVSGKLQAPAALPTGEYRGTYCIGGFIGLGADLDLIWEEKNILPFPGTKPWVVQPVVSAVQSLRCPDPCSGLCPQSGQSSL
jgi:hypothetical protein